ncbi:hypothetical protein ABID80_004575 [Streptomyces sp. PvP037]
MKAQRDRKTFGRTAAHTYVFAGLRLLTGFVFLRAFLDKAFGLGYATRGGSAWTDGGSPTEGFLGSVAVGPMESTFHDWAGAAWAGRPRWAPRGWKMGRGVAQERGRLP